MVGRAHDEQRSRELLRGSGEMLSWEIFKYEVPKIFSISSLLQAGSSNF